MFAGWKVGEKAKRKPAPSPKAGKLEKRPFATAAQGKRVRHPREEGRAEALPYTEGPGDRRVEYQSRRE